MQEEKYSSAGQKAGTGKRRKAAVIAAIRADFSLLKIPRILVSIVSLSAWSAIPRLKSSSVVCMCFRFPAMYMLLSCRRARLYGYSAPRAGRVTPPPQISYRVCVRF